MKKITLTVLTVLTAIILIAQTYHEGTISSDETWYASGNPHIVNDFDVNSGTLTIEPGCIVKLQSSSYLQISGNGLLIADGDPTNQIVFTSNSLTPAPGDWHSITFISNIPGSVLDYCTIRYGGNFWFNDGCNLLLANESVSVTNCIVEHSATKGIAINDWNSSPSTQSLITGCIIKNNGQHGITCYSSSSDVAPIINNCTIQNNGGVAIETSSDFVKLITPPMNITGNALNEIHVWGSAWYNFNSAVWYNLGVPYIIKHGLGTSSGSTLELMPGCELKFDDDYSNYIYGSLIAKGNQNERIVFTSNESSPQPGDWDGFQFYGGDTCRLEYCDISYGGAIISSGVIGRNILIATNNDIFTKISNCNINNSLTNGIAIINTTSTNIHIDSCLIELNSNGIGLSKHNKNGIYISNTEQININNCIIRNNIQGICTWEFITAPQFGTSIDSWNDIYDNIDYNIYNESTNNINAGYIYWGTTDSTEIANKIYDYYDDNQYGIVNFNPWTNSTHDTLFPLQPDIKEFDINVLLEGPFNGIDMNTDLYSTGMIPQTQPYNVEPWNYAGTESVASIPPDVVDWILLELRETSGDASTALPDSIVARQAAFLLKNGQIVDLDGMSLPEFEITVTDNLYLVLWHRNHVAIMSSIPLTESKGTYIYDFADDITKAYIDGQKEIGTGIFGMIAGDCDGSGIVDENDKNNNWNNTAGQKGYDMSDLNLDGEINNIDKDDYWYVNFGSETKVPKEIILDCGTQISDIDGNIYNTVQIGDQCWMKENLKATTYNNGTPIPNVTDPDEWSNLTTGAYAWYNNDNSWKEKYGALYNWYATVDANGLCPTGWHVPTHNEWTALVDFIGGTGEPHGNELKSCRQVNSPLGGDCNVSEHPTWHEDIDYGNFGTDNYGFSGLPGSIRGNSGDFASIGFYGGWWSSTEYSSSYGAWRWALDYDNGAVYVNDNYRQSGYSIRCLRD